ncbi:hypothetical protein KDAU_51290 [Dictyobacter aurantiacus]|uniref:Uncharacterized protein n=1 Tax=Dictyobacter aurantiacus TaxID=1936993 RepID=A0A401ZLV0_9CHLR|nr:hypothetical protein KDAU_51290 [Dictyobacter aurantiacus]
MKASLGARFLCIWNKKWTTILQFAETLEPLGSHASKGAASHGQHCPLDHPSDPRSRTQSDA